MEKQDLNIVLVSIGNFQPYIIDNIQQLLKLKYKNIYVITNSEFIEKLDKFKSFIKIVNSDELNLQNTEKQSKLNKSRNGFWIYTSLRFYALYETMKKYNLSNCLHLENDVLIYKNFEDHEFQNKLYITIDGFYGNRGSDYRCIPGIVYLPNVDVLKSILDTFSNSKNDMQNFGLYYKHNTDQCVTLPIIKQNSQYNVSDLYNQHYNEFEGIFDAAAMGQYLGGVDPRNIKGDSKGFVNETCKIKYNSYKFVFHSNENGFKLPYIVVDNQEVPIFTLHIHSKNLKDFLL